MKGVFRSFLMLFMAATFCFPGTAQSIRQFNKYKLVFVQPGPGYYEKGDLDEFIAATIRETGIEVVTDTNSPKLEEYQPCEIVNGFYTATLVAEFGRWMNYASIEFYDCDNSRVFHTSGEKRGTAMSGKSGKQNAMGRALEVFDTYKYSYEGVSDPSGSIITYQEPAENSSASEPIAPVQSQVDNQYPHKYALVIGNSNYETAPLKNPSNDAKAMTQALRSLGFEVEGFVNVTRKEMRDAIRTFGDKVAANQGVALFYYAGHGIQSGGINYLIPVDADIQKDYDIQDECVRSDMVLRMLELYSNPMNIIILDACRNNPFSRSFRSAERGLAQPASAPTGSIIAFATAPGKTASDGEGENGLYTQELIKAMQVPGLTIEQVFKQVRINVLQKSGEEQSPWENSSLTGDFFFRR